MARRKPQPTSERPRPAGPPPARSAGLPPVAVGVLVAALLVAAGAALALRPAGPGAAPTAPPAALALEPTDGCVGLPPFTRDPAVGLEGALALATDQQPKGLVLLSGSGGVYQHETWDDGGYLGAMALDGAGNVYVAPTPRQSLADNPLAGATTLWRADGATGAMAPFVTLPGAAVERNPFGVLGLAYACDLDLLYAGTVIGSTPTSELGGVTIIGGDGQIGGETLAGGHPMGGAVARRGGGYLLRAGLARSPEIVAVPLDASGTPAGPPEPAIDLTAAGATPSERARKLRLVNGELVVDLVPFNYSLQTSASGQSQVRRAGWVFDLINGEWIVSRQAAGL